MLLVTFFVPFVALATRIVAGPAVIRNSPDSNTSFKLPISRYFNRNGKLDLIQRGSNHWKNAVNDGHSSTPGLIINDSGMVYGTSVGVGSPPTSCESSQPPPDIVSYTHNLDNLILDTAGANTWLGANQPYKMTSSSVKTGDSVVSVVSRADLSPSLN
jgi:hypothetical protein